MPPPKQTYYTYPTGIPSKNLHLGNLVHNFRDPEGLEPFVCKEFVDPSEEAPEWAQVATLENYAMTLGKEEGKGENGRERYKVVAAAKTTRMEITEPQSFLTSHLLANPKAKSWLTSRLSAASSSVADEKDVSVWMLTGIILMTHSTWSLLSTSNPNDSKRFTPGLASPFDPAAVQNLRRLSVSEGVKPTFGFRAEKEDEEKSIEGVKVEETGKFPGQRVWATRWERVVWEGEGTGARLGLKSGKEVIVRLEKGYAGDDVEEDFDDDDKFWDGYLDKAEEFAK